MYKIDTITVIRDCHNTKQIKTKLNYVGSEVLTAEAMKNYVFCDITLYIKVKVNRSFGGEYCFTRRLSLHARFFS
jgi:hypothetical protein